MTSVVLSSPLSAFAASFKAFHSAALRTFLQLYISVLPFASLFLKLTPLSCATLFLATLKQKVDPIVLQSFILTKLHSEPAAVSGLGHLQEAACWI